MSVPSKEEIRDAINNPEFSDSIEIIYAAYKESVEALKDAVSRFQQYEMEVNYYDAPYYHRNAMEYYTEIISKYPEDT